MNESTFGLGQVSQEAVVAYMDGGWMDTHTHTDRRQAKTSCPLILAGADCACSDTDGSVDVRCVRTTIR